MGTPEFAVASLDALINAGANIVGVITMPDKPSGRGMQLSQSAVKKYAVEHNLFLLQPEKLKNEDFIQQLKSLNADVQIVVAFRMLPEIVWNMPSMGTINLHGSLLPQYRGAAPINWAIINGEKETGVTTFKLQHAIDTGNILLQEKFPIDEKDTAGTVHDKMKIIGAELLLKTLKGLCGDSLQETMQSSSFEEKYLKPAPKIFTETCKIDFSKTVEAVYNLIRGLSPFPAAFTELNGRKLKIFFAEKEIVAHDKTTGEYETDEKSFLKFACSNGFIHVKDIQLEGKKRMQIEDFLRGYRF
ncbi:methionyl-tRNA formyltransferase [Arachidicoccus ginsenosidimutans]|nr:methionyl-tRNA formyltransferase [Arachidicoccus sp. BS20]